VARRTLEEGKGCDIGYALAISSCEGANSVETCTVTALDAITAFAVPNPNSSSQSRRFFQVWLLVRLPHRAGSLSLLRTGEILFKPTLSAVDASNLRDLLEDCQCPFSVHRPAAMDQNQETQPIESLLLNEWEIKFLPFFHRNIHRCSKAWATTRRVWRNQLSILTPEKRSRMVVTSSPHRCQILWPTSMAALSGIPARRVLE